MTEPLPFDEFIERRYGSKGYDRGGWKVLRQIFFANLPYDTKIENTQRRYLVSRSQAVRWYGKFRALQGLK